MPIYEYTCNKCGLRFELLIRGKNKIACPKCTNSKLTRLFSTFSVSTSLKEASSSCDSRTAYCPCPSPEGTCPMAGEE